MANALEKAWLKMEKEERKFLKGAGKAFPGKAALMAKVPAKLQTTMEAAFEKAFGLLFLKGSGIIEKTFDKEGRAMDFEAGNYLVEKRGSKRALRRLDKSAKKGRMLNDAATTVSGLGLGFLGMGIPDIPLLAAALLKGVYEVATSYGYDYTTPAEQLAVLRVLNAAFAPADTAALRLADAQQDPPADFDLQTEIQITSAAIAQALLVEKFIQGIPVVGAAGALINHSAYGRVSQAARLAYKKRYLRSKGAAPLFTR